MVCFLSRHVKHSTSVLLLLRGLLNYDIENQICRDVADAIVTD